MNGRPYTIRCRDEEGECNYCGRPMDVGERTYPAGWGMRTYCDRTHRAVGELWRARRILKQLCPGTQPHSDAHTHVLRLESEREATRYEATPAGDQGILPGTSARSVPNEPIRKPELMPDGDLFQSDGTPTEHDDDDEREPQLWYRQQQQFERDNPDDDLGLLIDPWGL